MKLNDYQRDASGTAVYPGRLSPHGMMYCALKMNGEAGELAGHLWDARVEEHFEQNVRGLRPERHQLIVKEIGDVMWYLAAMADELDTTLLFVYGGEPGDLASTNRVMAESIIDEALYLNFQVGQIAELIGKAMRDEGYGMDDRYQPGALRQSDLRKPATHEHVGAGLQIVNLKLSDDRRVKVIMHMRQVIMSLLFIANELDITLQFAMESNIKKLADRQARGVLKGNGDNR